MILALLGRFFNPTTAITAVVNFGMKLNQLLMWKILICILRFHMDLLKSMVIMEKMTSILIKNKLLEQLDSHSCSLIINKVSLHQVVSWDLQEISCSLVSLQDLFYTTLCKIKVRLLIWYLLQIWQIILQSLSSQLVLMTQPTLTTLVK